MALKVGEVAPDFELPAVEGQRRTKVRLSDFRGKKHVVVTFHPINWTPTWAEQVPAFDRDRDEFAALNAQVLDISVDSLYSHMAWQKYDIGEMHIPMCSDFYPHGEVAQAYDVFRRGAVLPGISERAVFIVDKQGKIAFSEVYPLDQTPNNEKLLQALRALEKAA